jgi:hypothetical protein
MEMTLIKSLYNLLFTGGFCLFTYGTVYVPYILVPVKNMSCCFQSMIEDPEKVDWVQGEIPPIGTNDIHDYSYLLTQVEICSRIFNQTWPLFSEAPYTAAVISEKVNMLQKLALKLR